MTVRELALPGGKRGLRPVFDSLPRASWREAAGYLTPGREIAHQYPTEGCHGAPLDNDHPNRTDVP